MKRILAFILSCCLILSSTIANAATMEGWTLFNPVAQRASALYEGIKNAGDVVRNSTALITPNASQVAKQLGKGVAGVALSVAVEQLLGAVDWVLDPANNQIIYYEKPEIPDADFLYTFNAYNVYATTLTSACAQYLIGFKSDNKQLVENRNDASSCVIKNAQTRSFELRGTKKPVITFGQFGIISNPEYNPNNEPEKKSIPLVTVAQKVIDNAAGNDADAQEATMAAAADIVAEAENDEALRQSLVDQLEDNAKCPSGIKSEYGQCWICTKESYPSIRGRVVYAKNIVGGLGKCNQMMNSSELLTRYNAYSELGIARDTENACWTPPHQNHIQQAIDAKNVAVECNNFLGLLGQ